MGSHYLVQGNRRIPVDRYGRLLLLWRGDSIHTYFRIPLWELICSIYPEQCPNATNHWSSSFSIRSSSYLAPARRVVMRRAYANGQTGARIYRSCDDDGQPDERCRDARDTGGHCCRDHCLLAAMGGLPQWRWRSFGTGGIAIVIVLVLMLRRASWYSVRRTFYCQWWGPRLTSCYLLWRRRGGPLHHHRARTSPDAWYARSLRRSSTSQLCHGQL